MNSRLRRFLTIALTGLCLIGLGAETRANEERGEAPLVRNLDDLRILNGQLIALSTPSMAATVSLISTEGPGSGSGVVVSDDGLVLTAAHVVDSLRGDILVLFPDGSRKRAKALGSDFDRDAAMVQITEEGNYPHVEVGTSENLVRNQWCLALGHPGGFDTMRSPPLRLGRVLDNGPFITTDCAVVGGDSGGPLFDVEGKVIGIHSNIGASLVENRHVPIAAYLQKWDDLKSGKVSGGRFAGGGRRVDPDRPVLGVNLGVPGENGGVQLTGVMPGSPAEEAGLREGDLITKIDGSPVGTAEELIRAVGKFGVGDELKVHIRRGDKDREIALKLARLGDLLADDSPRRGGRERRARPRAERGDPFRDEDDQAPQAEQVPREGGDGEAQAGDQKNPLKELLDRVRQGEEFDLTEEDLERLGTPEEIRRYVEELLATLGPDELRQLLEMQLAAPDRFFESSIEALAPVTSKVAASTVTVQVNGKPVGLGTVVSEDGWIFTKDTETKKGKVTVEREGKAKQLSLVKRFPTRDLALFKGEGEGWTPVSWAEDENELPIGSLLTASDAAGQPLGIGLISVQTRSLGGQGYLGIQMEEAKDGVLIVRTTEGSAARLAGLRRMDVITEIDGKKFDGMAEFANIVRSKKPGDALTLSYRRGEKQAELEVKLGTRPRLPATARFRRMNELSGPLSAVLDGFPEALQHDIPLRPSECGGPLVDLDGRCIGINVSRAGRVKTLAVPGGDLRRLLEEVKREAPASAQADAEDQEREKVLRELEAVEGRLEKVEQRLESLTAP